MVGKRNSSGTSNKKSPVIAEPALANRPKRNISPKSLDITAGLSWREERELKKALYASLQEVKKTSTQKLDDFEPPKESVVKAGKTRRSSRSLGTPSTVVSEPKVPSRSENIDESSQDSTRSSTSTATQDSKVTKVHAQRKFAQFHAYGTASYQCYSPSTPPVKSSSGKTTPIKMFPKRAKTEDFLTFLCMRGSQSLPPHLDFFNFSRYDKTTGTISGHNSTRESSPSSTSTSLSNTHEETTEAQTFSPLSKQITPNKKAARASAGTPETCRGFVTVRPRLTKNSLKAQSPLAAGKKLPRQSPGTTPAKYTRSASVPSTSPKKISKERRGSEKSPLKLGTPDRLALKRKAVATLTSKKVSPTKYRKKALFTPDGTSPQAKENKREKNEEHAKKVGNAGRQLRVRGNLVKPKRFKRPPTDYIAMRLPKRQAKQNALKFYMESDDLDDGDDKSVSDDEVTFPKKRKNDRLLEGIDLPMKRTRLKKVEKKTSKAETHGKKLLRKTREMSQVSTDSVNSQSENSEMKLSKDSDRISTRSRSIVKKVVEPSTRSFVSKQVISLKKLSNNRIKSRNKISQIIENRRNLRDMKSTKTSVPNSSVTQSKAEKCESGKVIPMKQKGKPPGNLNKPSRKESTAEVKSIKTEVVTPQKDVSTSMTEVPTFYPTEEEFLEPVQYIQSIASRAEPYGMCKMVPPQSWKMEGKISEDTRFTTQKQFIHKMYKRFGPAAQELECIRRHYKTHNPTEQMQIPSAGGVEIDLCKLSSTVQKFGGMQNVIEKKKWMKIADAMNIPKMAQDRGTKLYDAYCKFLLSFNDLSNEEKTKLETQVKADRQKVKKEEQEEECVVKGKNMPLAAFNRMARNTATMWLKDEPLTTKQIESEFWSIVNERNQHVVVHGSHVDTKTQNCSLFPGKKDSVYSKHPWNLNNLPHHSSSILQHLGPVSGVTVPTLHVGMVYTASCWSTDVHYLPYVQYLHGETDTVWYAIPAQEEQKFRSVMREVAPTLVSSQQRWLKEDTAMVPPEVLLQKGVHVSRCVQQPRQFVVVFPKCYTATISCGYTLAESAHYATKDWISLGLEAAKSLQNCKEAELFSMDELLCQIAEDPSVKKETLMRALPVFEQIVDKEINLRKQLSEAGLKTSKRMVISNSTSKGSPAQSRRTSSEPDDMVSHCEVTKKICFLSMVVNEVDDVVLSLEQGLIHLQKKKNIRSCKLLYRHTEDELKKIVSDAKSRLDDAATTDTSPRRKPRKSETHS